uniref:Uncharacterized protein n=1 Tax=Trichobilharzia regenti TaxID=157069 RepID=A0AA85J5V9_TRIRE|nr:unnamed protein product [Trichobilharzia regenti]
MIDVDSDDNDVNDCDSDNNNNKNDVEDDKNHEKRSSRNVGVFYQSRKELNQSYADMITNTYAVGFDPLLLKIISESLE